MIKKWFIFFIILTGCAEKPPKIHANQINRNDLVKVIFTFKMPMEDFLGYESAYSEYSGQYTGFLIHPGFKIQATYSTHNTYGDQIDKHTAVLTDLQSGFSYQIEWNGYEGKPKIPIYNAPDTIMPAWFYQTADNFIDTYTKTGWRYQNYILFKGQYELTKYNDLLENGVAYEIYWQDGFGFKYTPSIKGFWKEQADPNYYLIELSANKIWITFKHISEPDRNITVHILEQTENSIYGQVYENTNWPTAQTKFIFIKYGLNEAANLFFMWDFQEYPTVYKFFNRILN